MALVLGSLSAFGALTIDMYLPAMPTMAERLGTTPVMVQSTLIVFIVGLALGQVVIGPLSDSWGRRPLLLAGLVMYALASAACAFAPSIEWLIAARVVQSLGAAAGTVLARAIARDLFDGVAMTRFLATLMMVNGLAPVLAPVVGGQILRIADWRTVFLTLTAVGVVLLATVALALPESVPAHRRRPAGLKPIAAAYRQLAQDTNYLRLVTAAALAFAGVFVYISSSSFVLQDQFGLTAQQFSLVFGANGLGIVLFGQLNSLLVGRVAKEPALLRTALVVAVTGAAIVLASAVADAPLWMVLVGLFLTVSMLGPVLANATSLAMAEHADLAGSASSLQGLLQFLVAGAAAVVAGTFGEGLLTMGVAMCITAFVALLAAPRIRRRAPLG